MAEVTTYAATARKDGRWWVLQATDYPTAISQVARLDQAQQYLREAIAFVAEVPEDEIEIDLHVETLMHVEEELQEVAALRRAAAETEAKASHKHRELARRLSSHGYSVRDIGVVLGVSYQRAHQLTSKGHQPA